MQIHQIVSIKAIILLKALHRFRAGDPHSLPPVDGSRVCDVESGGLARNRTGVQGFAVLCVTTPPRGLRRRLIVDGSRRNNHFFRGLMPASPDVWTCAEDFANALFTRICFRLFQDNNDRLFRRTS